MFGVLLRLYIKHVCCHHAISTTLLLDGKISRIPWGVTISSWIPRLIIDSVKHWCWWCKYPKLPWRYFLGLRSMWYHHWIYNLIDILTDESDMAVWKLQTSRFKCFQILLNFVSNLFTSILHLEEMQSYVCWRRKLCEKLQNWKGECYVIKFRIRKECTIKSNDSLSQIGCEIRWVNLHW